MLMAYRLVRLIETHSEQLADQLVEKLRKSEKTRDYYNKVPAGEFRQRVLDIYTHLGEWLLGKSEADINRRYSEIGRTRAEQGVALSELIWAIIQVKDHLLEFLKNEAAPNRPVEVLGELEMLQMLEQFFDLAIYYAAVGYEHTRAAEALTAD